MNWSNLAIAGETLSSIAVLATLVYLAIQTRQNTQATQANGRHMSASLDIQLCLSQAENAVMFSHAHDPELTDEQKVFFEGWLCAFLRLRELEWLNFKAGTIDEATWKSYSGAIGIVLSVPHFRRFWLNIREIFDPGFVSVVNRMMDEVAMKSTHPAMDFFENR